MGSPTRRPIALSLQGFAFSHRNSFFDWRLLHGIDADAVVSSLLFKLTCLQRSDLATLCGREKLASGQPWRPHRTKHDAPRASVSHAKVHSSTRESARARGSTCSTSCARARSSPAVLLLQARLTDVRAIEDCLDTLQHGSIQAERGLSRSNCMQVYRLLQLAVEYLNHLRSAHAALLEAYNYAIECADG